MSDRIVGVVGMGAMGRPIAALLARAGFRTLAFDRSPPDAAVRGVELVGDLAALDPADVVIVIVPTDDDVRDVVAGPDGLIAHGRPDRVIVICASVTAQTCRDLADLAAERGMHAIDAALTGGVRGAENGQINLLVGGPQDVVDGLADVFAAFVSAYHVLGDVGAGQVGKAASNLLHWAEIVAIDEAMRLAGALGVPPERLRRALMCGGTDSRTLREIELMRFTWYKKDIEVAHRLAASVGMDLPVAALSDQLMDGISVASIRELLTDGAAPRS